MNYNEILDVIEYEIIKCKTTYTNITKKIRGAYQRFMDEYSDHEFENLCLYDDDGNEIIHLTKDSRISCPSGFSEMQEMGYTDVYSIHNHPSFFKGFEKDFLPTFLSEQDFMILGFINYKAEGNPFIFRSQTACSKNGSMMSIMRSNDFSESDILDYDKLSKKCVQDCRDYTDLYVKTFEARAKRIAKYSETNLSKDELYKQAHKQTIEDLGTMSEYLKEDGIFESFKNLGCRLVLNEP